jgi:hypothetical protein
MAVTDETLCKIAFHKFIVITVLFKGYSTFTVVGNRTNRIYF